MMDFHVQKGEPVRADLWNALVDALEAANQIFPGKGIRRSILGGRTILSADGTPRTGDSNTPYILGSTKYASSMSGPHAHDEEPKWGGFDDVPTDHNDAFFDLTKPRLDEWHRSRRPLAPGSSSAAEDKPTDSVILDLTRSHIVPASHSGFYWSDFDPVADAWGGPAGYTAWDSGYVPSWGSFLRYTFKRVALFDSRNIIVSISAEQLMGIEEVDYGSGSDGYLAAWGGLLV